MRKHKDWTKKQLKKQTTVDAFEKQHSVQQIYKDRLGRYQFMPVRTGVKDCCGFVYHFIGRR